MKIKLSHPYRENLSLNLGPFTQILGNNTPLIDYTWNMLRWYFTGHKYSEDDLSLFNQQEPLIIDEHGETISRKHYRVIDITDIRDIDQQLSYKKGSLALSYAKNKISEVSISDDIEQLNLILVKLATKINAKLPKIDGYSYQLDSHDFTPEQLLLKSFSPHFSKSGLTVSLDMINSFEKTMILIDMLRNQLANNPSPTLLFLRHLDGLVTKQEYQKLISQIEDLTNDFPHLTALIFPLQSNYQLTNIQNIEYLNILGDDCFHFYSIDDMYHSFTKHYPSNQIPDENEFSKSIQKNAMHLFTEQLDHSLTVKDLVLIKIMNRLYQFDKQLSYPVYQPNPLEVQFLKNQD